jgi:uncharacterized NAD(P)/FAD-binding protein YdhS
VAIVGAGASGTLTAIQLLKHARRPLRIALVERGDRFGPGLAYGTRCERHLLNVPAAGMSAFEEDPLHFVRWLGDAPPDAFVPRARFGAYLEAVLEETSQRSAARLVRVRGEVVGDAVTSKGVRLTLATGEALDAAEAVLALGNPAPSEVSGVPSSLLASGRYVPHPWAEGALAALPKDAPLLLLGTGLTAVDVLLALREGGYTAPIFALSRRGLLPRPHAPHPKLKLAPLSDASRVRPLVGAFHLRLEEARRCGGDFRSVFDALRGQTAPLWAGLPLAERRRWMRHLRALWDVHRHRMAPQIAETLAKELASGRFRAAAGRVREVHPTPDGVTLRYRPRGAQALETIQVTAVLNCTGPGKLVDHPGTLLGSLLAVGQVRLDPLGLGLSTDSEGRLLDAAGRAQPRLWTLGPPRRGDLWESTAVPEIRAQARALAEALLR